MIRSLCISVWTHPEVLPERSTNLITVASSQNPLRLLTESNDFLRTTEYHVKTSFMVAPDLINKATCKKTAPGKSKYFLPFP
jgi:hypothetical protein